LAREKAALAERNSALAREKAALAERDAALREMHAEKQCIIRLEGKIEELKRKRSMDQAELESVKRVKVEAVEVRDKLWKNVVAGLPQQVDLAERLVEPQSFQSGRAEADRP